MGLGTVAIYGCGGFGINSARNWDSNVSEEVGRALKQADYAEITVNYVDTSRNANLLGDEPPENVYVVDGMDGAGKIRKESHDAFVADNAANQILVKCQPKALNIVLFSLSGGTGNTIGTELMLEMLERGHNVIGVVVASSESATTLQNTMGAVKTLDYKARTKGCFFTVAFEDNADNAERVEVDNRVKAYIGALAKLAAPGVRELDSADVHNWLRPDRIGGVNVKPQLALLDVVADNSRLHEIGDPLSIASLISDPTETLEGVMPEYSTVGYHPIDATNKQSFHFSISTDAVPNIAAKLKAKLDEVNKRRGARKQQSAITSDDDHVDSDGYVW